MGRERSDVFAGAGRAAEYEEAALIDEVFGSRPQAVESVTEHVVIDEAPGVVGVPVSVQGAVETPVTVPPPSGGAPVIAAPVPSPPALVPPAPSAVPVERSSADLAAGAQRGRTEVAAAGWRAAVRRLTFGAVKPAPGPRELAEAADGDAVRARWTGPKTVVVANPKGGAGKTPTTIGLAATFGDARGGAVLAWDANETLGTLGIRTPAVQFPATAVDLLEQIERFEQRTARRGDLGALVRAQASGNFHVLASDEDPRRMSQIDAAAFRRLHEVLTRYYDVLVIDTGNNPRADNFQAAIEVADALVIPIAWAEDKVITAGRLIDQLRQMGRGDLVRRAVTVVTGPWGAQTTATQMQEWRAWFAEQTADVVQIPTDAHISGGGPMTHGELAPATRRAFLTAAARVGAQFDAVDQLSRARLAHPLTTGENR